MPSQRCEKLALQMATSRPSTPTFNQLIDVFRREMARTRATVESIEIKKRPTRRARSATVRGEEKKADKATVTRKRARSETGVFAEGIRCSKRLRGIEPDSSDDVEPVAKSKGPAGDDVNKPSRASLERTASTLTTSTNPNTPDFEWFPQATDTVQQTAFTSAAMPIIIPDKFNSPVPILSKAPSCSPSRSTSRNRLSRNSNRTPIETTFPAAERSPIERLASEEITARPPYSNPVPPPVIIEGQPSLRICFRDICIFRHNPAEWQSKIFLQLIDPQHRSHHETFLRQNGYIHIPDTLFTAPPQDTPFIIGVIYDFCERSALPDAKVQSFSDFTDPFSGRVDPRRLSWWLTLSEYFNIPHRLDVIFNAQPGEWHNIFHDLHSFALMREFLEVIDKVGVKRTRERVHQELARRIAFLRTGRLDGTCAKMQFRLMRMGYVELREMSREFDGVLGENGRETCPMCVVQRPFKGDSTAMRQ